MIGPEHERAQPPTGEGFADAVTFTWGDPERELYGMARIGVSAAEGGARRGSALAVLFAGREPLVATAEGDLEVSGDDWTGLRTPGLRTTVEVPLERWTVSWDGDGERGFSLTFEAAAAPAAVAKGLVELGGMASYEQVCRVHGEVRAGGRPVTVTGTGQRGHQWGVADWSGLELVRTVSVWLDDGGGEGVLLSSLRPAGAEAHAEERVWAAVVRDREPAVVADPRLSTTYDGDGHQRRAGLELWVGDEDGHPVRAAGQVICGSTLDLGQLRLDMAFMRWHADGREGVGRYDILRRVR